jgi:hypothetical protein
LAALPEIGVPRLAGGDDLRGDLRQRLAGTTRLRDSLHDRPDAIDRDALARGRAALDEPLFPARRYDLLAWPLSLCMSFGCACEGHQDLANGGNSDHGLRHLRLSHHHCSGLDNCARLRRNGAPPHVMPAGDHPVYVAHHS